MPNIFTTITEALGGTYVAKDKEGLSYERQYKLLKHAMGRQGFLEDKKNIAKDMNAALKRYEQEKR